MKSQHLVESDQIIDFFESWLNFLEQRERDLFRVVGLIGPFLAVLGQLHSHGDT